MVKLDYSKEIEELMNVVKTLKDVLVKQDERLRYISGVSICKMKILSDLISETYLKATSELNIIFKKELNHSKYKDYKDYNKSKNKEIHRKQKEFNEELKSISDEVGLISEEITDELGDIDFILEGIKRRLEKKN
ncbi:MAG: hypothetical protein BAJALOKI2v1_70032 [Promethearchaeota archaeon]|nr:MAG: hypothetical protein BAJALOKI2v1_70032 [Candidatus Lokiarchaeota archaeon]